MDHTERLKSINQSLLLLESLHNQIFTTLNPNQQPPTFQSSQEPRQQRRPRQKSEHKLAAQQQQQQQQQQTSNKQKSVKPTSTANKPAISYDPDEIAKRYKHNEHVPPKMVCDTQINYINSLTNTEQDITNAYNENEKAMRLLAYTHQSPYTKQLIFYRAPSDYYDWTLMKRRDLLGAPTVHYLCKSMIMKNTKCDHTNFDDRMNSKYYCCVIQYSSRLHNDKIGHAIRRLHPESTRPPSKLFNFRVVEPEISLELTGQNHNGVTPFGSKSNIPIILSHRIAELPNAFLWLGGGEVDLKIRFSVADFIKFFNPIIDDITYEQYTWTDDGPVEAPAANSPPAQ